MKQSVYIETTVVSYLTGRPSRDMVLAAHQQLTRDWWDNRAEAFNLFVSELVQQEAGRGDPAAAGKRLKAIEHLPVLRSSEEAVVLAERLIAHGPIPRDSGADALHIAIAALNGMYYLLTWNCSHLANAAHRHRVENIIEAAGFVCPVICTPEELLEE